MFLSAPRSSSFPGRSITALRELDGSGIQNCPFCRQPAESTPLQLQLHFWDTNPISFDVAQSRTISVNVHDLDSVARCRDELRRQIRESEAHPLDADNPISVTLDLQAMRQSGDPTQEQMARVLGSLQMIQQTVDGLTLRIRAVETLPISASVYGNAFSLSMPETPTIKFASNLGDLMKSRIVTLPGAAVVTDRSVIPEELPSLPTLPNPHYPHGTTVRLTTNGGLYRNIQDSWSPE